MTRLKSALEYTVMVAILGYIGMVGWDQHLSRSTKSNTATVAADVKEVLSADHVSNVIGTGKFAIVEFSDFQCPFCGQFARDSFPTVKKELIDTGKVRYVSMAFPLNDIHPYAEPAAMAAECALRQGKYWEMHDSLFAIQSSLAAATASNFVEVVQRAGLDESAYRTCLTKPYIGLKILADIAEAKRLGVQSTPSFFVGRRRGDGSIELLKRINGAVPASVLVGVVTELQKDNK